MRSPGRSGKAPRLLQARGSSAATAAAGLSPALHPPPVEDVRIDKKPNPKPRWAPSPCFIVALPNCIFHTLIFCVAKETVPHHLQVAASCQAARSALPSHFSVVLSPPPMSTGAVAAGHGDWHGHGERSRKRWPFSGQRGPSARRALRKGEGREVRFPPAWGSVLVVAGCQEHSRSSCSN